MRYSLRSRFAGTILGSLLGRSLPLISKKQHHSVGTLNAKSLHWLEMAISGAESLIDLGRFDLNNWQKYNNQELGLADTFNIFPETVLAALPIALFFHENRIKLRENLLLSVQLWGDDPLVRDGTLAVGYAIAQSLRERLSKTHLISQTISFIGESSTNLPEQLLKVNSLLESQAGVERVQAELIKEEKFSNAIAIAFYCFLDTLEDFRLSVLRSTQIQQNNSHGINTITGALSGAYNSTIGIPVNWQMLVAQANSPDTELINFSRLLKLTDSLVCVWSGIYDFETNSNDVKKQDCKIIEAIAQPRGANQYSSEIPVASTGIIRSK